MVELSVVVLCYHSGKTILPIFDRLKKILEELNVEHEIILVANDFADSRDETIDIVNELARNHSNIKTVTEIKEGMMGWDMIKGMNVCSGNFICVIDGDGQFPIESVSEVYKEIKDSNFDIVKTYRNKRKDGFYRFVISRIYNLIFNLLFPGIKSKDVNSKPKIFSKDTYLKMNLQSTDWFIDAEIMIYAKKQNLRIKEIPISFYANESRKSFVKFDAIFEFILNLIKFRIKEKI